MRCRNCRRDELDADDFCRRCDYYCPTPERIREHCRRLQRSWDAVDFEQRSHGLLTDAPTREYIQRAVLGWTPAFWIQDPM